MVVKMAWGTGTPCYSNVVERLWITKCGSTQKINSGAKADSCLLTINDVSRDVSSEELQRDDGSPMAVLAARYAFRRPLRWWLYISRQTTLGLEWERTPVTR